MTVPIAHMVCGCLSIHVEGCDLGVADTVASAAMDANRKDPIPAVLSALLAAGLIRNPKPEELDGVVDGLLDAMCDLGLIGGAK